MVSAATPEVPAAIVLNGNEQPSHSSDNNGNGVTAEPSSYASSSLSPRGAAAGLGIDGGSNGSNNGSHSHSASRRASNQSKELSEMELPDPSWLSQARGQRQLSVNASRVAPQTADGLLTTHDSTTAAAAGTSPLSSNAPMVASIPSSPYTGSGAWSPAGTSAAKFGDTAKYEELVARLEALNLPEPEILTSGSKRDEEEKERILKELQDVIAEMELPEPEYIQKYALRSQGAKTPEPQSQQPGEAMSPKVARATSIKRANAGRGNGQANGNGAAH